MNSSCRIKNKCAIILNIDYTHEDYGDIYFAPHSPQGSKYNVGSSMHYESKYFEITQAFRYYFKRKEKHKALTYAEAGVNVAFMNYENYRKIVDKNNPNAIPKSQNCDSCEIASSETKATKFNHLNGYFSLGFLNPIGKHFYFKSSLSFHLIPFILERNTTEAFYNIHFLFNLGLQYRFYKK